ncbi:hypothetical protein SAMN05446927_4271 [Caballeronia arationis]|uniref:Uncharacterized protein n=1 Tax=Caballeronia arationis TaxID=1777142 RepID=A0A7Z7I833_9BURK|nr:hypothetical protein SAMN05446927_4271 [Caballeronia arationis]
MCPTLNHVKIACDRLAGVTKMARLRPLERRGPSVAEQRSNSQHRPGKNRRQRVGNRRSAFKGDEVNDKLIAAKAQAFVQEGVPL